MASRRDPTDPNSYLQQQLADQPGGTAGPPPPDTSPEVSPKQPNDPKVIPDAPVAPPASSGTGNSMKDWADSLLKKYGYKDNGAGSGFGDESYWLDHLNALSGSGQDQMKQRWENDLAGKGTDNPGPGDAGNTSRDPNVGGGSGGGGMQGLNAIFNQQTPSYQGSSLPSVVSPNMGGDSSFLDNILKQLQQLGGTFVPTQGK